MNEQELEIAVRNFLENGSYIRCKDQFFPKSSITCIEIDRFKINFFIIGSNQSLELTCIKSDQNSNLIGGGLKKIYF